MDKKKIIILILLLIIGICFSYNIIEGLENEESKEEELPELSRFKELNDIIIGGEKDNEEEISINDFFAKLTQEKCEAIKDLIDLVNNAFSEEPGEGNETIKTQMNAKMKFSDWASMFSMIVGANIGTTIILKKDNKCGITNYINSLGQNKLTIGIPSIGGGNSDNNEGNDGEYEPGFWG